MAFVASGAAVQNHGDGMSRARPLKVGILTTDNRDHWRKYDLPEPIFGPAIAALFEGMAGFSQEVEIHVISVTQKPLQCPPKIFSHIFYHSLVVPKMGWLRTGYQGCVRAVRKKVRELGLALVHGQGTERDCAIEAVFSGRPNILTLHGNMRAVAKALVAKPFSYHWFHAHLESLALRRTNMVFCNSSYTETWVHPLNQKTLRMPNPVRTIFYEPRYPEGAPPASELRFLVVGLIGSYKQPLEILRALRILRERSHTRFHCLWVGAFSGEKQYVGSFIRELEAARLAGWADHRVEMSGRDLREAMDTRDVLIHIPREEAFGLVIAEAMLRGMAVVAGRTGGIVDFKTLYPEIRIVNPEDQQEWLKVLTDLSLRPPSRVAWTLWDYMKFHPREIARHHLEAYHAIVSKRAANP